MTGGYFAPLVLLPHIITKPGLYRTRDGGTVKIERHSTRHDFGCYGIYDNGIHERWHKSGRIFATSETANDIIAIIEKDN